MKKEVRFFKILFIAIFCMFFLISTILIKQSVENNADYYKYKDVAVSVSAIVSDVNVYEDSDNNKEYRTYIDYEYGGKKYYGIYWDTFSSKKTVGQQVIVKIIPYDPTHIFKDDIGAGDLNAATYMFCIVVSILLFCIYGIRKNKNEDILKVIDADIIYEETKPKLTIMMIFVSIAFARIILIYMYPSFVNYDNSPLSTFIVIAMSIVLFMYGFIKCKTYSLNNFSLTSESCTNKRDSDTYDLHFANGKVCCSFETFYETQVGDDFFLLLNKKGKILNAYNQKKWRMSFYTDDDIFYQKKCMKNFGISVIASLIIAVIFVTYFSIILCIMQ